MSLASRLMPRGYGACTSASIRTTVPWGRADPGPVCGGRGRGARRARHVRADAARRARLPARHERRVHRGLRVLPARSRCPRHAHRRRERRPAPALASPAPAACRPLPADELRAPVRRQLLAARPADRPLLGPDQDHRPRPHRGARDRAARARLSPPGTRPPRPLSAARARAGGTPLPLPPRRDRLLGADRLAWAHARPRRAAYVHLGQPRQGDAARGVPAPRRQPRPDGGRAGPARPDDHALGQRARERRLRPCGRRRPARARRQGRDAELLRQRLLVGRTSQRGGPGALLPRLRPARATALARLRARVALVDRRPGSAGASPAFRSRPASTPSSRAAGAARALAGSSTRRRSSSAGRCACRWPC